MARPRNNVPLMKCWKRDRRNRSRWLAYADIDGRRHTFGVWKSKEAAAGYASFIRRYTATGGKLPSANVANATITDLAVMVMERNTLERKSASTGNGFWRALRRLRVLLGDKAAASFAVADFLAYREMLISEGMPRESIVKYLAKVKLSLRGAHDAGMLAPEQLAAVTAVNGVPVDTRIKQDGRRESVDPAVVQESFKRPSPVVADMVKVRRWPGMRPGEIVIMRPMDIDRSDPAVWYHVPSPHKGSHRGQTRTVALGRRGIEVLKNYIDRAADAFCFDPRETMAHLRNADRQTPGGQGNSVGANRKQKPKHQPASR